MTTRQPPKHKPVYRVLFQSQGGVYELYARKVSQSDMYAFVEIEDIVFGERSQLLVDPSEERLKAEFGEVRRTHVPVSAVLRIDEVQKEGVNKIHAGGEKTNVAPFPGTLPPRMPDKG